MQIFGAEDVAQRRLGQQPGRVMGVLHVGHRHGCVGHAVIDDGVHRDCHAVPRQHLPQTNKSINRVKIKTNAAGKSPLEKKNTNLLGWNVEDSGTQVHFGVSLDTRQDEEDSWGAMKGNDVSYYDDVLYL